MVSRSAVNWFPHSFTNSAITLMQLVVILLSTGLGNFFLSSSPSASHAAWRAGRTKLLNDAFAALIWPSPFALTARPDCVQCWGATMGRGSIFPGGMGAGMLQDLADV